MDYEWISVEDRLPQPGVGVLCLCHRYPGEEKPWRYVISGMLWDEYPNEWVEWCDTGKIITDIFVTHWTQIPELP
jgi:hypothetical protein